ncbi:MAG: triose-phosphate isomerase [Candidatus Diapherotrites archaeon]|uniref:Triosephosphate isomerase n=1 Tax=Candidatus Iainarchaeum sp. TaxID=3101447 RepID=A0A2D6LQ89_9ARCH|nr:triose-phosphate isomerase [Candidatus Diapherotrites archaeon]
MVIVKNYLFVNFKTYEEASGDKALALAKLISGQFTGEVEIIPVAQSLDLKEIASNVSLKVFAQHIDPISFGSNTGKILPEAVKSAGAVGTVLNHAENKVENDFIEKAVQRCKEVGLTIMLCAENLERAKQLATFNPDFIAVEPPELIGGDISVSTANPELISDSVKAIHEVNKEIIVITGAGVKNSEDVKKAVELGCQGVFVASGIVSAKDKEKAIKELLKGFR